MTLYDPAPSEPPPEPPSLRVVFVREAIVQYRGRAVRTEAPIQESDQAVAYARRVVRDHAREHFLALYLDGRYRPVAHSVVSVGTATASLVHPREVFQTAVLSGATACIVLHNHPSGDPSPSAEDQAVTKRLREAGAILGIQLLDSIVWSHASPRYASIRELNPAAFAS